jgi:BirA family transcriptional regulator, biotin operon repressor / biotin---[acetyl-CoA-carboxylase] ligase
MKNTLYLASTVSTNEDAYNLALKGAEHGTAVLADTQLDGRGRLGREWLSPPGTGLYCSIVVRPKLPFTEYPKLTLTAGLALCTVIETLLPDSLFGLKWPNDLYCKGRKAGGILVESSSPLNGDEDAFAVVGIGVNVNTSFENFPVAVKERGTSLFMESDRLWDISGLYQQIHESLLKYIQIHEQQGFAEILKEWSRRDVLLGKEMQWLTRDKKVITGCGMGPDENGQLLARDREGKVHEILSGDVQLFEGDKKE